MRPLNKRWWYARDPFFVAWFIALALAAFAANPSSLGGFGAGINLGFVIQYFLNRKMKERMERAMRQDEIDVRTLHMLCDNMTYKTLHQMEKSALN